MDESKRGATAKKTTATTTKKKKNTKKEAPGICLVFWDLYRENLKIQKGRGPPKGPISFSPCNLYFDKAGRTVYLYMGLCAVVSSQLQSGGA